MRVVLVHPPPTGSLLPMATLTLAAISRQTGQEVELVDLPERGDLDQFLAHVSSAHVIGFSTICSYYPYILVIATLLKQINPRMLIVFGGPQATSTADATVHRFPFVDLVIRGEAETGWQRFLLEIRNGSTNWKRVPGAVWTNGIEISRGEMPELIEDLDSIPHPLFSAYRPMAERHTAAIEVGRGCPYACTFCSTNTFFARRFRLKSPKRILAEMDELHATYGVTTFDFIHDMFTVREDSVLAICAELKKRPYVWSCSSRTDRLNPKLVDIMYQAGCRAMYFGVETGSQKLQRDIKKNLNVQNSAKVMRQVKERGIEVTGSIIAGFPQETIADLRDTILMTFEMRANIASNAMLFLFAPLADTPLGQQDWDYAYDGVLSNALDMPGQPSSEEAELIGSDFEMFGAFYHPTETEYSRRDYIALMYFVELLDRYEALQSFLLRRVRGHLVEFLTKGGFSIDVYKLDRRRIADAMIRLYAGTSEYGELIWQLYEFDCAKERVRLAPSGTTASVGMHPAGLKFALQSDHDWGGFSGSQYMHLNLTSSSNGGVDISFGDLAAASVSSAAIV